MAIEIGGVDLHAQGDISIDGDVVGRDKIINTIDVVIKYACTAAEEAEAQQELERKRLAEAVVTFSEDLRASASASPSSRRPYKGLFEYRLGDAGIFFGRTQAIEGMMEHILGQDSLSRLTILHAESGTGKTSLIQAGLTPRLLAQGALPFYVSVRASRETPTVELKQLLLRNLKQTPGIAEAPLRDFMYQVVDILGKKTSLFVFFDQFEEFFTQQLSKETRVDFVDELGDCLDDDNLPVRFVLSLRDEFFGQIGTFEPRIRYPCANQYLLLPLTRDEAREAILKPAQRLNIQYEEGLVDALLDDLQLETIAPPQLQLVCWALYKELKPRERIITRALYDNKKGVAGILQGYLERVLKQDLPLEHRHAAKSILSSLVTSTGQRDRKSQETLARELGQVSVDAALINTVLGELVDNRLLRKVSVGDLGDQEEYELVHDYLMDEVRPWIDQDRLSATRIYDMLAQAQAQYKQYQLLLNADQLEIIKGQLHNPYLNLDADDCRFLLTSAIDQETDISPWMKLAGAPALDWIRAIQRESPHPEALRLAAAATLGQLEDEESFAELRAVAMASPEPRHAYAVRALAHFMHASQQKRHSPRPVWLWVELRLAALRLHADRQNISALSRAAGLAGALSTLITISINAPKYFSEVDPFTAGLLLWFVLAIFSASAFFLGRFMGSILAGAQAILARRPMGAQVVALIIIGSVTGSLALLPMVLEKYGWAAGAVIGATLAWARQPTQRIHRAMTWIIPALAGALAILACLGTLVLPGALQGNMAQKAGVELQDYPALLATGFFAFMLIRQALTSSQLSSQAVLPIT